jgi:signal transduction histidine kinase
MVLRARDGHRVSVDVRVARIRGDRIDGAAPGGPAAAVGVVVALHDITDRKHVEAALEEARADAERARSEAEAANHAKSEFLATMSHELRTPLNAIGGFAQLIADGIYGTVEPRQTEALGRIKRAQELLLGLINAVLNFAKVQAGHVSLDVADFGIRSVLEDVRVLVLPPMQAKQLAFTVGVASDPEPRVRGDREKVQQILLNLLSNAAKFTAPGGRVAVEWRRVAERVDVTVTDTGIGIPPDKINLAFEPFVQLGSDRTTIGQGTGLGLAISRELARSMNGDLSATSEPGTGSAFTLSLPAARAGR